MTTLHFIIDEERRQTVTADALSKEDAAIFITAPTMPEALELIPEGEALAAAACENWKPEEGKEEARQDPKQARQERMQYFESSGHGKRFLRSMELSKDFIGKKNGCGLLADEVFYLLDKTEKTGHLVQTIFDVYCLAFRKGYTTAQKHIKEKNRTK